MCLDFSIHTSFGSAFFSAFAIIDLKGSTHGNPHSRSDSFSVWSAAGQSQWYFEHRKKRPICGDTAVNAELSVAILVSATPVNAIDLACYERSRLMYHVA
ncbi:hypothetical protein Y032_0479g2216 [Ancylostoma ceylanicum]|uniref:Uncharacterized protein n=1 Tax=Ancylostoma ceylanicum TaxID=53326 RepID=A0A016WXS0_9BILA|nr:hypothetical protein Y032_0479g2216 [Ancylostoma ceylanicum]